MVPATQAPSADKTYIEQIADWTFLGNSTPQWAVALAIAVVLWVVVPAALRVILNRIKPLEETRHGRAFRLAGILLAGVRRWFLFVAGIWLASNFLSTARAVQPSS